MSRALQSNDPAGLPKQRALRQANALFEDAFMYTLLCCLSHARGDFLPTVVEIGMPGESVKGLVVTDSLIAYRYGNSPNSCLSIPKWIPFV